MIEKANPDFVGYPHEQNLHDSHVYEFWMNGARQHLVDLEPSWWKLIDDEMENRNEVF